MAQTKVSDTQIQNSGVAAGSYTNPNVTVNVEGFVTAISNTTRTLTIYISGMLMAGADACEITLPSTIVNLPIKRVGARQKTAGMTATTFQLQLATATGAFTAAQTSDTFTIAANANQMTDVTSFTSTVTGNPQNAVRLNIVQAGTGATDLVVRIEFGN